MFRIIYDLIILSQSILKIRLIIIILTITKYSICQQDIGISLYNQYAGIFNPSSIPSEYIDFEHQFITSALIRTQWTKLKSAPKTQSLKFEYISNSGNNFDLLMGGYLIHDKAGQITSSELSLRVASFMNTFRFKTGGFSLGMKLGLKQLAVNTQALIDKYPDDILTQSNISKRKPSLGLGITYYNFLRTNNAKYYSLITGFSINQLAFSKTEFSDENNVFNIYSKPHFYWSGSIKKFHQNDNKFTLNAWVKYINGAPLNSDVHFLYFISKELWLEIGCNTSGIGHTGFGIQFFDLFNTTSNLSKINYSFNPPFFDNGSFLGNTHELLITYSFL